MLGRYITKQTNKSLKCILFGDFIFAIFIGYSVKHKTMASKEILLKALEYEKNGDWNKAHALVQDLHHTFAFWIHAYLHRKEPDLMNASYWYSRAKKQMPDYGYDRERKEIFDYIKNAEI